ncbi:MAG: polyribonucleotide nucleotidyltransferase, partial [Candidatus Electryoneaceae bacterium]|nr:polyribonucleotide nucleotidyltransferase [Candidatus Electryoneaceae bacterium]
MNSKQEVEETMYVGGRPLKVIVGKMARQAHGALWMQYGDTVMHVATVSAHKAREGMDFLPLTMDFREKFSAAGKIPGGFFKREGRPHENEVLNSRMMDRPIRPLFPDGYRYETQVMAVVLSSDGENDPSILGPTAASLALNISDIPMNTPIASIRIGLIDGEFVINPLLQQFEESKLDLVVVGSETAITMVEGHAIEVSNQQLIEALFLGHEEIKKIVEFQKMIIEQVGKPTREYSVPELDEELIALVEKSAADEILVIGDITDKTERNDSRKALVERLVEETESVGDPERTSTIKGHVKDMLKRAVRRNILDHNRRMDGRCNTDIRQIDCEVGLLPRAHGSALFTRGQTQALGTATLGTKDDEQRIDSLDDNGFRKYMLHYNFPGYCTGEVKGSFGTSRREIGHGKLGERAIEAVLPKWEDFPYTIRVTSDIMESNGSSSMATVCAGSLALMDAGVPLRKPVAGIAMGLIMEEDGTKYRILTDILGDEDHLGDMDFKVAGTRDGITAFQMDIKIAGVSAELMAEALGQ